MRLITRKVSRTDAYKGDINGSIPSNEVLFLLNGWVQFDNHNTCYSKSKKINNNNCINNFPTYNILIHTNTRTTYKY